MTKEEKIKLSYEEIGLFSGLANENGWKNSDVIPKDKKHLFDNTKYGNSRPKSLQGIETNNGWIKIESEVDLPTTICDCWVIRKNKTELRFCKWSNVSVEFHSHYQPIVKPDLPIY